MTRWWPPRPTWAPTRRGLSTCSWVVRVLSTRLLTLRAPTTASLLYGRNFETALKWIYSGSELLALVLMCQKCALQRVLAIRFSCSLPPALTPRSCSLMYTPCGLKGDRTQIQSLHVVSGALVRT